MKLQQLISTSKCIILDFDDTIAGTEKYSWIAHQKALDSYDVKLTKEHIKKYISNNDKIIFSEMEKDFNIKIDFNNHFNKRLNYYIEEIINSNLQPYNFITQLLANNIDKDFYILSSNSSKAITPILKKWNIYQNFKKSLFNDRYEYHERKLHKTVYAIFWSQTR